MGKPGGPLYKILLAASISLFQRRALGYYVIVLCTYLLNCIGQPLGNTNLSYSPQARISEAEECIDGLNSKAATTEKLRSRYQLDLDELQNESERISSRVTIATKKLQTFDKVRSVF